VNPEKNGIRKKRKKRNARNTEFPLHPLTGNTIASTGTTFRVRKESQLEAINRQGVNNRGFRAAARGRCEILFVEAK
jgi:hypothetical protein